MPVPNRNYKLKRRKYLLNVNKYSIVGIATRQRFDGPGIESRWGARSSPESRLALGHIQPVGVGSFPGVKYPGRNVDHASPSSAGVKERVQTHTFWAFVDFSRVNFNFTFYI